ncbi:helix-turn-helix transcriptional regulator [Nocardia takedensis]
MRPFEFTFATPEPADPEDPRLDHLLEHVDATAASHSGLHTVTVVVDGPEAISAGRSAAALLTRVGLRPRRFVPDLVDRADIAERAAVTRQAVGNWTRGERRTSDPFPPPYAPGVWMWGDVAPWLHTHGHLRESVDYPTGREHAALDGWLQSADADICPTRDGDWSLVTECVVAHPVTADRNPLPPGTEGGWIAHRYALASGE